MAKEFVLDVPLLRETARPFWAIEKTLSIDSTGLVLQGSGTWRQDHRPEGPRDYAKIHILSGARRRATLGVITTRGTWHDATHFEPLLEDVPEDAIADTMVGDGAYWNRDACDAARYVGLRHVFKLHANARRVTTAGDAFERMNRWAQTRPTQFKAVYHQRSTSESRNATEKLLFGDRLRSRRPTSRRNDVLAREVVHNARLLTWLEVAGGVYGHAPIHTSESRRRQRRTIF